MENIKIKRSAETPYFPAVSFDAKSGICEISGESYMEETYKFYLPLISWLKEFMDSTKEPITFEIKLIYLNTSTSKCILDILELLKSYKKQGKEVIVNWYYDIDDPDMIDEVEDFEAEAEIDINLKKMD
ncbi:MAG: DUF1987 domain-containing protein [Bacteroidales bacterium]|jgi:hypothetical protein|nr:DUF1987 domain-containing protein [Bacteroidales bacterium]